MDWINKKVLIIGFSLSGRAAAKYLADKGCNIFITELNEEKPENKENIEELHSLGIKTEFGGHTDEFTSNVDLVIVSPSVPLNSELYLKFKNSGVEIISELDLAYIETNVPFIGITGTNGKTTTTALTSHLLSAKFNSPVCGNIGKPPCDLLKEKIDFYVCEVSSFQSEHNKYFNPKIACWTNFTPDHITWHGSLENYFKAKSKLFYNSEYNILNGNDEKLLEFSKSEKIKGEVYLFDKENETNCSYIKDNSIYFKNHGKEEKIIELKDCPLVGHHNYQNIMCGIIISKIAGLSNNEIRLGIMSFKAPEHRLEKVTELNGTIFYNDSKATNPEASIVAIDSFNNKDVVLIAGGRDKFTSLDEFCNSVNNHIKTVVLIGEATERFEENLKNNGFSNIIKETTLESAIDKSIELNPDVVLLSPACASFDMFTGYEQRGKVFKDYVLSKK